MAVQIDETRDVRMTVFGRATLRDRYLQAGEGIQDLFARVAQAYGDDDAHAQRIYDYMSRLWFMPATPILSNGGTNRGLPISCFLNETDDSLHGIVKLWNENVWLASNGGGIGSYWGNLRAIGEKVGGRGQTSGVVPFLRVQDSLTLAISQGNLRRGSSAVYMPVWHPEIEEFIEIRRPTGGDPNRKTLNIHHGIVIPDAFMEAVEQDNMWELRNPHDNSLREKIKARNLWIRILTARIETGEPYLLFIDHVNGQRPDILKKLDMPIKTSNLCSEITLPTGVDHRGQRRTAVCCLSSVNAEFFREWQEEPHFIDDIMRFLDNVLEDFIQKAPVGMEAAVYSAQRERSVGLGVMGFHSFLQKMNIPFESVVAKSWNKKIFSHLNAQTALSSKSLAAERGACPDAIDAGLQERFTHRLAIAPTASISIIAGGTSPGIEPIAANSYTHKTLSGSFVVRNRHLAELLEKYGYNQEETWHSIVANGGSVQHLDFLSDDEKMVYRTAHEIDQRWVIEHAADRTPFICQAQSVNLFLQPDIHKRDLHELHFQAWKKGMKSLYYCRSLSLRRSEALYQEKAPTEMATNEQTALSVKIPEQKVISPVAANTNYEECLACQ